MLNKEDMLASVLKGELIFSDRDEMHCHLPMLISMGIVTYNSDTGRSHVRTWWLRTNVTMYYGESFVAAGNVFHASVTNSEVLGRRIHEAILEKLNE